MENMLSRSEAAKELGIWPKTLMSWVDAGKLKVIRNEYDYAFFNKEEVLKLKQDIENSKPPIGFKDCSKCLQRKSIDNFTRASICKDCISKLNKVRKPPELNRKLCKQYRKKYPEKVKEKNDQHRFKKFNIDKEEFARLEKIANYKCQICGVSDVPLCIDHDHTTNKIRGLLCSGCNLAIGNMKDSIENFQNAISYLQKHQPKPRSVYKQLEFSFVEGLC